MMQGPLLYNPPEVREEKMTPVLNFLNGQLDGKDWLAGNELTVSDIAVG
jgi:glutathione S-transferase